MPAAVSGPASGSEPKTLRVLVAPWSMLRHDSVAGAIDRGPGASGVFVRFSPDGGQLTLLDRDGRATSTVGPGAGLIAATAKEEDAPVWVVTGTDASGVEHAAGAFERATLQNRFAVAVRNGANGPTAMAVPR